MGQDPLDYQVLLQNALRSLVRQSLEIVAEQGFTDDHHFYLSFRTAAPGVVMPSHMRDTYPDEMTIVLKTQFKDLTVEKDGFSVGLFFGGVLYYLTVPFAALLAFSDPSASFQLVFQPVEDEPETADESDEGSTEDTEPAAEGVVDNVVAFSGFRKK